MPICYYCLVESIINQIEESKDNISRDKSYITLAKISISSPVYDRTSVLYIAINSPFQHVLFIYILSWALIEP